MLTRLGALRRADDGVTLTELLVAMSLSTLLGALTLSLFVSINSSTAATTDRSIGAAQARTVLQAWTAYLHVSDGLTTGSAATRFTWIRPTSTAFYADLNNRTGTGAAAAPTLIWLRFDQVNKELVEEQFAQPASYPATPTVCRVLAQNVTTLTVTGYTSTGTAASNVSLPADVTGAPCQPLASAPASDTTLSTVTSVGLDFTITATDGTRPQRYTALATVPQLGA